MSKEKIYIYDTTLRDGQQTHGIQFSMDDKLNMFELKPGQCIRLKTSKYEIEEVLSEETVKAGIPTYKKNI